MINAREYKVTAYGPFEGAEKHVDPAGRPWWTKHCATLKEAQAGLTESQTTRQEFPQKHFEYGNIWSFTGVSDSGRFEDSGRP
jgi:hypothetical protein